MRYFFSLLILVFIPLLRVFLQEHEFTSKKNRHALYFKFFSFFLYFFLSICLGTCHFVLLLSVFVKSFIEFSISNFSGEMQDFFSLYPVGFAKCLKKIRFEPPGRRISFGISRKELNSQSFD